jgi:hypothetical protein
LPDIFSEEIRERGQAKLRAMITVNRDDIDWAAVIRTSNELNEQEQSWLKEMPREDRRKSQRRALKRRKKVDAAGSFSVNLLTYRGYDDGKVKKRSKHRQWWRGSHGSSTFYSALEDSVSEASSGSAAHRSCDTDTMDVMDDNDFVKSLRSHSRHRKNPEISSSQPARSARSSQVVDFYGGRSNISGTNLVQPCREDYCTSYIIYTS